MNFTLPKLDLDPTTAQQGLQIPGVAALQNTLNTIILGATILSIVFVVLYIINMIQRFRADRAMIAMRKDIAAIRQQLEARSVAKPTPPRTETLIRDESARV